MTKVDAPAETAAGAVDYLLLALICLTSAVAGVIELLLVPRYLGGTIFPICVPLAMLTTYALPMLGFWLTRAAKGAVLPLVCWIVPVLVLGFWSRPDGDVVIAGGNSEQWVALVMIVAAMVVGFRVVIVGTLPPRQLAPSQPKEPSKP